MLSQSHFLIFLVYILSTQAQISVQRDETNSNTKTCPFVYDSRQPSEQYGLVNCTWYSSNACCKRTEVTAVFNSMLPLNTVEVSDPAAAKKCRNLVNYMMCYFCSPDQEDWYNQHLMVCAGFCDEVYSHCADAKYNTLKLGEQFRNGQEFCESQRFEVVPGESSCFKFDPTVFDTASYISVSGLLMSTSLLLTYSLQ